MAFKRRGFYSNKFGFKSHITKGTGVNIVCMQCCVDLLRYKQSNVASVYIQRLEPHLLRHNTSYTIVEYSVTSRRAMMLWLVARTSVQQNYYRLSLIPQCI